MSRNREYNPTERTAKRAAELWKRMLRRPKFDNGDQSGNSGVAVMLAHMIPTNITEELLDAFADKLVSLIMTPDEKDPEYFPNSRMHVDYGPCHVLSGAAESVGLKIEFPWQTNMWVHADSLSVRHGYGAETVFHYALENGKWLVTTLSGPEIDKIKRYVVDGTLPEFKVESEIPEVIKLKGIALEYDLPE